MNKMLTNAALSLTALSISVSASVNQLSEDSSWEEIRKNHNIEIKGDGIKVGSTNTSVFFVEEKDGKLYTLKPTKDGYYKRQRRGGEDHQVWVDKGESIKSGDVTVNVPQYEKKRINKDRDQFTFVGYKKYEQPLTRELDVYEIVRGTGNSNDRERFLFKKEFVVPTKM